MLLTHSRNFFVYLTFKMTWGIYSCCRPVEENLFEYSLTNFASVLTWFLIITCIFRFCQSFYRSSISLNCLPDQNPFSCICYCKNLSAHQTNKVNQCCHLFETGSGYLAKLPLNEDNSLALIQDLKASSWLDHQTRLVLLQMNLYNVESKIFASVTISWEVLATGGAIPYISIQVCLYSSK